MYLFVVLMTIAACMNSVNLHQEYENTVISKISGSEESLTHIRCPFFKYGPDVDVKDLVGSWMTVYTQPKAVSCFTVHIRATTDLERDQLMMKYGTFGGRVDWSKCYLEVETKIGKHYFQGDGSYSGILENIIITEEPRGTFEFQDQTADQWTIFGRRGSELLLMRDCAGEAVAIFVRAPYWPALVDLYAILHRSGIAPLTKERVLCEPYNTPSKNCLTNTYYSSKQPNQS